MTTILPSSIPSPHEAASTQSTPVLEIPGAFPREPHTATTRQRPLSDPHRAPDRPQRISLPSSEKEGVHPGEHCGGVGPLPGNISETSVAKLPDERASERKAASAPAARSKELSLDTDRGDEYRGAVAAAVAPASFSVAKEPGGERPGEGEAASESASRPKELTADTARGDDVRGAVAPASFPLVKEPGGERASEGEATSESTSRPKELTGRGDEGVPAAGSGAPGVINLGDSQVRRTDPQGPGAVGEQVPAERHAETRVSLPS